MKSRLNPYNLLAFPWENIGNSSSYAPLMKHFALYKARVYVMSGGIYNVSVWTINEDDQERVLCQHLMASNLEEAKVAANVILSIEKFIPAKGHVFDAETAQ